MEIIFISLHMIPFGDIWQSMTERLDILAVGYSYLSHGLMRFMEELHYFNERGQTLTILDISNIILWYKNIIAQK